VVTPTQRRAVVTHVRAAHHVRQRRACRALGVARSTQRYRSTRPPRTELRPPRTELRRRLQTLALLKPRWGCRRLHWLLRREGWAVNRKCVQRVYREEGLAVRQRPRKRVSMPRVPRETPTRPNER
jgi:putative transposase